MKPGQLTTLPNNVKGVYDNNLGGERVKILKERGNTIVVKVISTGKHTIINKPI